MGTLTQKNKKEDRERRREQNSYSKTRKNIRGNRQKELTAERDMPAYPYPSTIASLPRFKTNREDD